jgi:5-formyltetrahydrofolate cyclo-ligase
MRREKIAARRAIPRELRRVYDEAINESLILSPLLTAFPLVAAYVGDGSEPELGVSLRWVLGNGGRICLPSSDAKGGYFFAELESYPDGLVEGAYGLLEPAPGSKRVDPEELKNALWLVPGVAFDESGGRLGRGKGVYDRLLACGCGLSIGVFYECQKVASLPKEGHDRSLDMIVTESGLRDAASLKKKGVSGR